MNTITINSPGKLILSGEHAVVYGAPACALAVNKTIEGHYQTRDDNIVTIHNTDLNMDVSLSLFDIYQLHDEVSKRYDDFKQGHLAIHQVTRHPIELCWFAIAQTLAEANVAHPLQGFNLRLSSNIPLGCGMGSSAALIVNVILGINALFNLQLAQEKIFALALTAENLQHGYSSGLDVKLSLTGGMHVFRKNQPLQSIAIASSLPLQYVNSGKPESSTGECVAHVKQQNFSTSLWQEFETTTLAFIDALKNNHHQRLLEAIKKNHRLLCHIGVVPTQIQSIIADIESQGGAAKICGAGSIRGNNAGMILMTTNVERPEIELLTANHCGACIQAM